MPSFNWTKDDWRILGEPSTPSGDCDWSEIDALCRKLSTLLDCHDRDRFSALFRYGWQI